MTKHYLKNLFIASAALLSGSQAIAQSPGSHSIELSGAGTEELDISRRASDTPVPSATSRIEVADLKERVKRLEAIAAGIDI